FALPRVHSTTALYSAMTTPPRARTRATSGFPVGVVIWQESGVGSARIGTGPPTTSRGLPRRGTAWPLVGSRAPHQLLEVADDLAALARAQGLPGLRVDAVGNEPHRAVAQEQVHAPGVPASGRFPGVFEADAVPLLGVGRVVVVVQAVLD